MKTFLKIIKITFTIILFVFFFIILVLTSLKIASIISHENIKIEAKTCYHRSILKDKTDTEKISICDCYETGLRSLLDGVMQDITNDKYTKSRDLILNKCITRIQPVPNQ